MTEEPLLRTSIPRLGTKPLTATWLTLDGLPKQMRGNRPVSRQTVIILDLIEELRRLQESRRPRELPLGGKVARRTQAQGS